MLSQNQLKQSQKLEPPNKTKILNHLHSRVKRARKKIYHQHKKTRKLVSAWVLGDERRVEEFSLEITTSTPLTNATVHMMWFEDPNLYIYKVLEPRSRKSNFPGSGAFYFPLLITFVASSKLVLPSQNVICKCLLLLPNT